MTAQARFATGASVAAIALVALAVFWLLPSLLGLAGGTVPEVATVLASAARPPAAIPVPGDSTPLVGQAFHFQRVTVTEEGAERARAVATLDFEGTYGPTKVSSLGRETTHFLLRPTGWALDGSLAPTLGAAVAALVARRRALEAGDVTALAHLVVAADRERAMADPELRALLAHPGRNGQLQAWYLRSERGEITVTEEEGNSARRLHRLRLVPREGATLEFVFAGSLL